MAGKTDRTKVVSKEVVIQKLNMILNELRSKIPVDSVYLYGSYVNGCQGPYSNLRGQVFFEEGRRLLPPV